MSFGYMTNIMEITFYIIISNHTSIGWNNIFLIDILRQYQQHKIPHHFTISQKCIKLLWHASFPVHSNFTTTIPYPNHFLIDLCQFWTLNKWCVCVLDAVIILHHPSSLFHRICVKLWRCIQERKKRIITNEILA